MWYLPRMLLGNMLPWLQMSRNVSKTRRGTALLTRTRLIPRHTMGVAGACFHILLLYRGGVLAFSEIHVLGVAVNL